LLPKLTTVYDSQSGKDFLKAVSDAQYGQYVINVVRQHMGDSKLTRFELYQAIHHSLPYLKHIVYKGGDAPKYRFVFDERINFKVDIEITCISE